jgi:transposase
MKEQTTFASMAWAGKKKQTKRDKFLSEMDRVVPWEKLLGLIEAHYPKAGNSRRPIGLERMVRIYLLQQWYGLSDPGMEEALYDIESVRRFAGIELGEEEIPDESTILNFRHLLEKHQLTEKLFEEVNGYLSEKKLLLREGTIMDATLIAAPSSTKNKDQKRDGEMSSTKKGNNYHFGMKVHTGTDSQHRRMG